MFQGSCHCGAVRWTYDAPLESATACNCTICRRYAGLWAYDFENGFIGITGETKIYTRGKAIEFHFCPTCACIISWRARYLEDDGRRRMAVNLRLAEPETVADLLIDHFDGLHSFDDLPRDGRRVKDLWF